jgi:hypothetical protein
VDSAVLVFYGGSSQLRLTRRGRRPVLADGLFSPDHGDRRPGADQALDFEVDVAAHLLSAKLAGHRGYQAMVVWLLAGGSGRCGLVCPLVAVQGPGLVVCAAAGGQEDDLIAGWAGCGGESSAVPG